MARDMVRGRIGGRRSPRSGQLRRGEEEEEDGGGRKGRRDGGMDVWMWGLG